MLPVYFISGSTMIEQLPTEMCMNKNILTTTLNMREGGRYRVTSATWHWLSLVTTVEAGVRTTVLS